MNAARGSCMQLDFFVVAIQLAVKGTIQERSHNDVQFFGGGEEEIRINLDIVKHIGLTKHHRCNRHHQDSVVSSYPIPIQRNFRCPKCPISVSMHLIIFLSGPLRRGPMLVTWRAQLSVYYS